MNDHLHWDPVSYLDWVREGMPAYDELQDRLADATRALDAQRVLDLGSGTGETARRVLDLHPRAQLIGVDASAEMLGAARTSLGGRRVTFHVGRLEDPFPSGPFDLVTSALAVHHLTASAKRDLYARVASALRPGGRFVLGDLVVPDDPADAHVELSEYDHPSPIADQLDWLERCGLEPHLQWTHQDLMVIAADRPPD